MSRPAVVKRSLRRFAETRVLRPAKTFTPVDKGTLRDSGLVEEPEQKGTAISVEIAFGGAAAEYALYVHEDLDAYHSTGQAKFLERAVREAEPKMSEEVARDAAQELGML